MAHSEAISLNPEDTGGIEMQLQRQVITVLNPHTPESTVHPKQADIEVLIWQTPDLAKRTGKKIQYIVMGGMNINAVEVHPILAMLTNHADTIIGIAHPDAPQSKLLPNDTPFNEERSFANSGYTILQTIKQLQEQGTIEIKSPLTVVGFSTGGAVLLEAIAQDIQVSEKKQQPRSINQALFLSPGGILELGGIESILSGVTQTGPDYWQEFLDTYIKDGDIKNLPKALLTDFLSEYHLLNWLQDTWTAGEKFFDNLKKSFSNWRYDDDAWRSIIVPHFLFEMGEFLAKTIPGERASALRAHFHRMWINQPGWPHLSPQTNALKRSMENVAHDSTEVARKIIHSTPILVWFGANDRAIPPENFLTSEDQKIIAMTLKDQQPDMRDDLIIKRIRESFPNDKENIHILLGQGIRSHHLAPRSNATLFEHILLKYFYPEKYTSTQTIFYGKGHA